MPWPRSHSLWVCSLNISTSAHLQTIVSAPLSIHERCHLQGRTSKHHFSKEFVIQNQLLVTSYGGAIHLGRYVNSIHSIEWLEPPRDHLNPVLTEKHILLWTVNIRVRWSIGKHSSSRYQSFVYDLASFSTQYLWEADLVLIIIDRQKLLTPVFKSEVPHPQGIATPVVFSFAEAMELRPVLWMLIYTSASFLCFRLPWVIYNAIRRRKASRGSKYTLEIQRAGFFVCLVDIVVSSFDFWLFLPRAKWIEPS